MEVSIIFKIGAVGILVSVLSQILKHSGREEPGVSGKPFGAFDRAVLDRAVYLSAF